MALRVAVAQAAPVPFDTAANLEQVARLAGEAAAAGARVVAFGETFLSGYPSWLDHCPGVALWGDEGFKRAFARLRGASILVPGTETAELSGIARDQGVVLAVGASERVGSGPGNGTLFNSLLLFDADGRLVLHHRKLVPTFTERLLWGQGDGRGLGAVETAVGRVGGLICWEHWMPLARQALHDSGELLHVALWPAVHDLHQLASRHYAFEGRCFVLAAGQLLRAADLPTELAAPAEPAERWLLAGGSAVYGPDGACLAGPLHQRAEILVADLDPQAAEREKATLDVSGHYQRPDVFRFAIRQPGDD
ncbi:MAG TPA: carbon-nitrogen hydrolase family protein [Thermoanaerobaculia bacterium]|jgi:predicted amidohydrolase|nr:carbon-nitrogen hydrolase family protein [Thermoanaerobaculia bacterium]